MRRVPFFVQAGFGIFFELLGKAFYDLRFEGMKNLEKFDLPVIYVSNHKSWVDHFIIIAASLRRRGIVPIHLLVHDQMWKIPVVGHVTWLLGAYPANRGKGINTSLAPLKRDLARGECVGVYPEGACIREKDVFGEPKVGAAYLAYHTGRAIAPMAIKGLEDLKWWGLLLRCRKVSLKFGAPFYVNAETVGGASREEIIERGKKFIMGKIVELYRSIIV